MFGFFDSVSGLISLVIDFFSFTFTLLIGFFSLVGQAISFIGALLEYLPPFLVPFFVSLIIFSVVTWFLNRG